MERTAQWLVARGVRQGDRIAVPPASDTLAVARYAAVGFATQPWFALFDQALDDVVPLSELADPVSRRADAERDPVIVGRAGAAATSHSRRGRP